MGRSYSEVPEEIKTVPYKIKKDKNNQVVVHIDTENKDYSPQEISAAILTKMK